MCLLPEEENHLEAIKNHVQADLRMGSALSHILRDKDKGLRQITP